MSRRNITYIKPQEPNFLTRLKAEAGYTKADTLETKVGVSVSPHDFGIVSSV
jgi:hypothetical protein